MRPLFQTRTDEPDFVAECHDDKHTSHDAAARSWFILQGLRAGLARCRHPRLTVDPITGALLFEAWREPPEDPGEPEFQGRTRTDMRIDT